MQRLVKKLKALRAQDPHSSELPDLESQLAALKTIDTDKIADYALKNKLKKDRLLSANADIQAAISSELGEHDYVSSPAGSPALKIENRLLSSKALSSEVSALPDALKNILDPSREKAPRDADGVGDNGQAGSRPRKVLKVDDTMHNSESSDAEEAEGGEDGGWESGSVHEGGQPEEDDGWESGSIDDVPAGEGPSKIEYSSGGRFAEDSEDDAGDEAPYVSKLTARSRVQTKELAPAAKDSKGKSRATGAESTFLPSLAVGYIRGDSDASDLSEDEVDAPRKNRRGQRARRAIWEKKYGKNAVHVKKQHEADAADPRQKSGKGSKATSTHVRPEQGSRGRATTSRSTFAAPQRDGGWANRGRPTTPDASQTKGGHGQAADKPLHPSWEAKKRLKEKLNPSIIPAQGKKIVF